MAQNWNVKQALAAINKGNKEAITDIGRRFPLTLSVLSMLKGNDAAEELVNAIPDHITTRKIEAALKDGIQVDDSDNDVDVDDEVEKKSESKKQNSKNANNEYSSLNGTQLADLLKEHGVYTDCKKKMGGAKRQQMLDYIEKYGLEGGEAEVENDAEEETTEDNPYAGKNAMELFKECKKRGIKAKPKQKAAFYVDLLMKDDQSNAESDDADDDWEDEEEEKPAKKETKKNTSTKKATKKEEPEDDDDDDDDWNI